MKQLKLHVLASGSGGNVSVIEDTKTKDLIVIDCGLSWKSFIYCFNVCDIDVRKIKAILITHAHNDHIKGLGVTLRQLAELGIQVPVYMDARTWNTSEAVREAVRSANIDAFAFSCYREFVIGNVCITAFDTCHDIECSCGFIFEANGDKIGFVTDTGCVSNDMRLLLRYSRVLAIESNYDMGMLETCEYPLVVKARVSSDKGHLSNVQAAELLKDIAWNGLEEVIAMHVSQNSNTYDMAEKYLNESLIGTNAYAHTSYQSMCVTCG